MVYTSSTLMASVASAALAGIALGLYVGTRREELTKKWSCFVCGKRKRVLPKKMILVRHGESEGNIDPLLYGHVPDNAMHLTELGYEQGIAAGKSIKQLIGNESLRFIVSPYTRTIETFQAITKAWGPEGKNIPWTEEPRIREQDFGNFQDPLKIRECKSQRRRFGSFFYRFPSGESPADVFDRISSFLESLFRMFKKHHEENYVLVTHGVAIRVILTRYFKYRISEFEQLENFHNGEFVVLEYDESHSRFNLSKIVSNHVTVDERGHVTVKTDESSTLRVHGCGVMASHSMPYPTSPINHFRRASVPPPPLDTPPTSSAASSPSRDDLLDDKCMKKFVEIAAAAAPVHQPEHVA